MLLAGCDDGKVRMWNVARNNGLHFTERVNADNVKADHRQCCIVLIVNFLCTLRRWPLSHYSGRGMSVLILKRYLHGA